MSDGEAVFLNTLRVGLAIVAVTAIDLAVLSMTLGRPAPVVYSWPGGDGGGRTAGLSASGKVFFGDPAENAIELRVTGVQRLAAFASRARKRKETEMREIIKTDVPNRTYQSHEEGCDPASAASGVEPHNVPVRPVAPQKARLAKRVPGLKRVFSFCHRVRQRNRPEIKVLCGTDGTLFCRLAGPDALAPAEQKDGESAPLAVLDGLDVAVQVQQVDDDGAFHPSVLLVPFETLIAAARKAVGGRACGLHAGTTTEGGAHMATK